MSVKFNVVERGRPADPQAPKKFYPSIVCSGRVKLRQLAQEIARVSTVSSADTMAVIEALLIIIPNELANGNIVELGDFGSFWLQSKAEGSDTPDDVDGDQITRILPRFIPGKEFKQVLDTVEYERA